MNYSFTLKPLDTENDVRSCGCYQIVIKGTLEKPESLDFTGFFEPGISLPLAPAIRKLNDFV